MTIQTIEQAQSLDSSPPPGNQLTAPNEQVVAEVQAEAMYLDAIRAIATNPEVDVNKLPILLDVQERMLNRQAETLFTQAFVRMAGNLPRIAQDKRIIHKGTKISSYASYEKIDSIISPILREYGFALSYNSDYDGKHIYVEGTLMHTAGHKKTNRVRLEADASGAKNSVQGVGSALSYGQRYCVKMLLNLVFEGDDDDGQAGGLKTITDNQAAELKAMIEECYNAGSPVDMEKFLHYVDAPNIDAIQLSDFFKAKTALNQKIKQAMEAGNAATNNGEPAARPAGENIDAGNQAG